MRAVNDRSKVTGAVLLALVTIAGGCGSAEVSEARKNEIRELLEAYLPRLAEAYATGNVEVLRGLAAEKELAVVYKKVEDLMAEEGRVVEPTLVAFQIEDVQIPSYSNAYVTTLETWDLVVKVSGTDTPTSSVEGQVNRVKYQLAREQGKWVVIYRLIEATLS